jgi:hypothetical protein
LFIEEKIGERILAVLQERRDNDALRLSGVRTLRHLATHLDEQRRIIATQLLTVMEKRKSVFDLVDD